MVPMNAKNLKSIFILFFCLSSSFSSHVCPDSASCVLRLPLVFVTVYFNKPRPCRVFRVPCILFFAELCRCSNNLEARLTCTNVVCHDCAHVSMFSLYFAVSHFIDTAIDHNKNETYMYPRCRGL